MRYIIFCALWEMIELKQNWPYARKWVRFENLCPKSGLSPPLQIGAQKPPFSTPSQLNSNLNGYILRTKHDVAYIIGQLRWQLQLGLRLKTLVHKRLKIGPSFLHILRKFCFLLHCQALQSEINKRNSTKLYQTMDSISR